MTDTLMLLTSIFLVGISAQWFSWRLRIPSILVLLLFGFLMGPISGYLKPDDLLGPILFPWVSMSVAIILFEGGLSLRLSELEKIGKVLRNLVTVGILVTWALATVCAKVFLKMDFSLALLLGAILVVTGPTVIMPMLRSLRVSEKMASVLKWEAMLNDPIGAILAVLVFEGILAQGLGDATSLTLLGLFKTMVVGVGLGAMASWCLKVLLKKYWIPDFLQSAFTLMVVLVVFAASNILQAESGLVAVTIFGVMLANQKEIMVKHIVEFKENLRVLLISSLFIVLGARLNLSYLTNIGTGHVLFILCLLFVIRPLTVYISTLGSSMTWQERVFLAWLAPRGIVAAAVASIFAIHLEEAGYPEAEQLLVATFLVIISTVGVYGLTAPWVARWLKLSQPNPQGVLIAGGHDWARRIAQILHELKFRVLIIDTNSFNVRTARNSGIPAIRRDILAERIIDDLELGGIGRFLSLTPNSEVNSLAAIHFAEVFGRGEVYQLGNHDKEDSPQRKTDSKRLHGRILFGENISFEFLETAFEKGAKIKTAELTEQYTIESFRKERGEVTILFAITDSDQLKIMTTDQTLSLKAGYKLIFVELKE